VLLEHPGPWGTGAREAAFRQGLGEAGWARLEELWLAEQLRPLIVRRPARGGGRPARDPADVGSLFVGAAHDGRRWLERLPAAALADLDLEAVAAGRPGHGRPVDGPLLAVCTNGTVDRCCAVRGRPLAAALAAAHPERTWEVSHLGGCRFAANLLVLPDGVLHGMLTPEAGLAVAKAAVGGWTRPASLRGRTGTSAFSSTAEVGLRRGLQLTGLDDLTVLDERPHADTVVGEDGPEPAGADVVLSAAGRRWLAVVRVRDLGRHLSVCDGTSRLSTTELVSLTPA
jgi:hypothetical protein